MIVQQEEKEKSSNQGFISLVFQAAVFSLSITGRARERLLLRCSGGINQGRLGFCSSVGCYPEAGCFPDLKALSYQRDCLPQSAVFSTVNHEVRPFAASRSAISKQQDAIRWGSCCSVVLVLRILPVLHVRPRHASAHQRPRCPGVCRVIAKPALI